MKFAKDGKPLEHIIGMCVRACNFNALFMAYPVFVLQQRRRAL